MRELAAGSLPVYHALLMLLFSILVFNDCGIIRAIVGPGHSWSFCGAKSILMHKYIQVIHSLSKIHIVSLPFSLYIGSIWVIVIDQ